MSSTVTPWKIPQHPHYHLKWRLLFLTNVFLACFLRHTVSWLFIRHTLLEVMQSNTESWNNPNLHGGYNVLLMLLNSGVDLTLRAFLEIVLWGPSQFPRTQGDVFKLLVLYNQQSITQRYSIYSHKGLWKPLNIRIKKCWNQWILDTLVINLSFQLWNALRAVCNI